MTVVAVAPITFASTAAAAATPGGGLMSPLRMSPLSRVLLPNRTQQARGLGSTPPSCDVALPRLQAQGSALRDVVDRDYPLLAAAVVS
eukprot:COSAG01_NODE_3113_length_6567_cov_19.718615_6_plen_88_part_00